MGKRNAGQRTGCGSVRADGMGRRGRCTAFVPPHHRLACGISRAGLRPLRGKGVGARQAATGKPFPQAGNVRWQGPCIIGAQGRLCTTIGRMGR
ncbi:hypothetical protein GCM10007242_42620 [Pigmentiphaga litoralis]|nr:hypothetical protein GCM10007242_42620 [Pigmentiphaga litoralis]